MRLRDPRQIEKFCCNQAMSDEVSLDQSDHSDVSLENEVFLHQSNNIQVPSDQSDSNGDLCRTRYV